MGIPYTGTGYLSSAMAMDKGVTKAMFQMRGVPTPAGKAMKKKDRVETPQELGMDFRLLSRHAAVVPVSVSILLITRKTTRKHWMVHSLMKRSSCRGICRRC